MMNDRSRVSGTLHIGDKAPDFSLPGVDGKTWALSDLSDYPILLIVFSCNHCPYVQAYEDRMIAMQREFEGRLRLVAINSNDAYQYPEDSFEEMKTRAKKRGFNFLYLRDDSQSIARAYGATHTPQLFVLDSLRQVRYSGKFDDQWQKPQQVARSYVRDAVERLLSGSVPAEAYTHAIGCTIKWKSV